MSNLNLPTSFADLTADEARISNMAEQLGRSELDLDKKSAAYEAAKALREQHKAAMVELLLPYHGEKENPRIRAIFMASELAVRAGSRTFERALQMVQEKASRNTKKWSKPMHRDWDAARQAWSRIRKACNVASASQQAGNSNAAKPEDKPEDKPEATRAPRQPGTEVIGLPEYKLPPMPPMSDDVTAIAWTKALVAMLRAGEKQNAKRANALREGWRKMAADAEAAVEKYVEQRKAADKKKDK